MNLLERIKREVEIAYLFGKQKNYIEKNKKEYDEAVRNITVVNVQNWIISITAESEYLLPWEVSSEKWLKERADFLSEEWLYTTWWTKLLLCTPMKEKLISTTKESTLKIISERNFGEALCQERDGKDYVVFNLDVICKRWICQDFLQTIDPKKTIESIVKHEFRHAKQIKALRDAGGSELVLKAFNLKRKYNYGVDPMEWDAFQVQIGSTRSIDEFVEEVIRE